MKNQIRKYEDSVSEILSQYNANTSPENLDIQATQRIYKQYTPTEFMHLDPQIKEQAREQAKMILRSEYYEKAIDDINHNKALLRQEYDYEKAKIERKKILALTGQNAVDKWAKQNGITPTQARSELDQYAAVKKVGYADTLADRYAAVINRDNLKGQDRLFADLYLDDEYTALGIKDSNEGIKRAEHYLNLAAGSTLQRWNTSGYVIERQLYRKNSPDE